MAQKRKPANLFDCWEEISRRAREAKTIKLFLDFDGTLVDFRFRPDEVKLNGRTQLALRKLAGHRSVAIAIVSGRRRGSVGKYLQVPRILILGVYGWENGKHESLPRKTALALSQVRTKLAELPAELPGIRLEDKGLSVAVHFRRASHQARRRAQARIRKSLAEVTDCLRIVRTQLAWDVVPRQVGGKDHAVREVLARAGPSSLPIYIGDDSTDEPAFFLLRGGVTVLVGPPRRTHAHFGLRNPGEVCQFLERLESVLS